METCIGMLHLSIYYQSIEPQESTFTFFLQRTAEQIDKLQFV